MALSRMGKRGGGGGRPLQVGVMGQERQSLGGRPVGGGRGARLEGERGLRRSAREHIYDAHALY